MNGFIIYFVVLFDYAMILLFDINQSEWFINHVKF